ncbi:MAG: PhzF family phenazine biosynthesis protein [Anaerolineae bacterium]|nr:PhzF family phenazine biosynthesis protein [Gloeobacterales cyanobacterium ES-bin-313]
MNLKTLPFSLVDVFASEPFSGNGLSVFLLDEDLPTLAMQRITQEMRQFETIFLRRIQETSRFIARIFTMEEELMFAGHPIIGAASLLHSQLFSNDLEYQFEFTTPEKQILATSYRQGEHYSAEMDQGIASVSAPIPDEKSGIFLAALNLSSNDLAAELPMQVVSTGLPYLIVPVHRNLERARIVIGNFEDLLASVGAKFVYVLDVEHREGRTWDNDGRVEDIATGSAAGPAAVYLVIHQRATSGENITLHQGRFLNRPSALYATVRGNAELSVTVSGQVFFVGNGFLRLPHSML